MGTSETCSENMKEHVDKFPHVHNVGYDPHPIKSEEEWQQRTNLEEEYSNNNQYSQKAESSNASSGYNDSYGSMHRPHPHHSTLSTAVDRFLTKDALGFIPRTSGERSPHTSSPNQSCSNNSGSIRLPSLIGMYTPKIPGMLLKTSQLPPRSKPSSPINNNNSMHSVQLPPLKRVRPPTSNNATMPLPSFHSVAEMTRPFRYQRSLSCPSDEMTRPQHPVHEATVAPHILASLRIPYSRLERSSSVDATTAGNAVNLREMQRNQVVGKIVIPESIDLYHWLSRDRHPLESLAESAQAMRKVEKNIPEFSLNEVDDDEQNEDQSRDTEAKREKKLCVFPGCASNAVTKGLCISHGGGRRCQRKGCTRGAQSKGLCVAHGGGRICKMKGCSNIQRSMGLCIRHGGGKRCSVPGCQKGVVRQDLCTAHGGKRKCKIEDCTKHVKKKGLCRSHANSVLAGHH